MHVDWTDLFKYVTINYVNTFLQGSNTVNNILNRFREQINVYSNYTYIQELRVAPVSSTITI